MPGVVDFDGAGAGNCFIWHLSYEDGITGLEVGMNTAGFSGCYSLSNSIEVIRIAAGDCQANSGQLFGGPFEIQPVDADTVNSSISHTEVLSPFPIGQKGSILTSKVVASLTAKPSITERLSVYCCHSCVVATLSSCNNTAPVLSNICTPKNWA